MKQQLPQNKHQHPANSPKENGHIVERAFYSGPLPHPQQLKAYDDITPGAADRIIAMAERENAHRHKKETAALKGMLFNERFGTACALLIGLAAIGGGGSVYS